MAKIEAENINFCYGERGDCFRALDGLSLRIDEGEFVCILGRSGSGKTTLLRMLAGLERPREGRLLIDGKEVAGPSVSRAMVFQDYALFPWMSAVENVSFAAREAKKGMANKAADGLAKELLKRVGMEGADRLYPSQLSGGMRQRVAIARALAMDPEILLLDEPFGALDAKTRAELQSLLEELWLEGTKESGKRKTVIFVTHDLREAALLGERILFMAQKRIVREIRPEIARPRTKAAEAEAGLDAITKELSELFYEYGAAEGMSGGEPT